MRTFALGSGGNIHCDSAMLVIVSSLQYRGVRCSSAV